MKKVLLGIVLIVVVAVAGAYGWRWYLIQELRKPILAELTDPDSAKFRNEKLVSPWTLEESTLCGEVNARNKMGGYVGYVPFTVDIYNGAALSVGGDKFTDEYNKALAATCDPLEDWPLWWWIRW